MKRKYLHIETIDGSLYVYADDKRHSGDKLVTLDEMDDECDMGETKDNFLLTISTREFLD